MIIRTPNETAINPIMKLVSEALILSPSLVTGRVAVCFVKLTLLEINAEDRTIGFEVVGLL